MSQYLRSFCHRPLTGLFVLLLLGSLAAPVLAGTTDSAGSLSLVRSGSDIRIYSQDLRQAGKVALGYSPSFVVADEGSRRLYAANETGKIVRSYDISTGAMLRQADLGGKAVAAAYDAQRGQLFVLDQDRNSLKALDAATLQLRKESRLGSRPVALALSPARGLLYVAGSNRFLAEVSADSLQVLRKINDLDADAVDIKIHEAADLLVVQHDRWVSVYGLMDLRFRDYLPLEGWPQRIQIDATGSRIFVQLKDETDNIAIFDARSLKLEDWVNVGRRFYNGSRVDASTFSVDSRSGDLMFFDNRSGMFYGKPQMVAMTTPVPAPSFPVGVTPGPDIEVNTTIDNGAQTVPNAEFDGYGNFAITWTDDNGNDGSGQGVFIRKYLANQTPVETEFRVNQYKTGDQGTSSVTYANNGDVTVIWRDASGRDGDQYGIYGRMINGDDTFKTDDFLVNQTTGGRQLMPSIAGTPDGRFIMAWSGPSDGDGRGAWIRMYDANGNPTTGEMLINTSIAGNTWATDINANNHGDFVVVWRDDKYSHIHGRAYHSDGTPVTGTDFQAGPVSASAKDFEPSVTVFDDASFIVCFREQAAGGVVAQRYNADQTPNGGTFVVSSRPTGQQYGPYIAGAPDGRFVVAWRDNDYPTFDIIARLYNADGTPNGPDFVVPDGNRAGDEFEPTSAMDDAGNFLVVYKDRDGQTSIAARYFSVGPPPTPMQITSVSPVSVNLGDTNLDLSVVGDGFPNDAVASFPDDANITVNSTTFVDAQHLTVNITVGALTFLGLHDIKVTTGTGSSATKVDALAVMSAGIYPDATVTSIVPGSASQNDSLNVTINGTNFVNDPSGTVVDFGADITVSNVAWVSSTVLTADISIAATAATGLRDVNVTNPGAAVGTCTLCFDVVLDPTLFSDNFDDNNYTGWTVDSGSWTVNGQALEGHATSGKPTIHASGFAGCGVCSIEADIKRGSNADAYVSLLGWYVDSKNYVELRLDKGNNRWLMKQKVNGDTVAKATTSYSLATGVFYHIVFAFDGTNFTASVDGNALNPMPKGAGSNPNGTVGFRAKGTYGTIDNVQVFP